VDALEIVSSTGDAAFATDEQGCIVIWNRAAERLLGYKAESVLGKRCCAILCGRDVFGNCFCGKECAVQHMARQRQAINHFEMAIRKHSGESLTASFSILVVPGPRPSRFTVVHLLQPLNHADVHELARRVLAGAPAPALPADAPASEPRRADSATLSGRETEVLRMLSEGISTQEIAETLFISLSTTRNHIQHILQKLEVHSKLEAVAAALRTHLI
jgi:DNA-binding CsgD family transcriptional regulator